MRYYATLLLAITVAACTSDPVTPSPVETEWTATLAAMPDFPGVTGSATVLSGPATTTVMATLQDAQPGSVLPWHIHYGTCDNDQGIVGAAAAYPHLMPDAGGSATATATVGVVLQPGQPYFVNVHASPEDLPTIVACGQLAQQ
jgi:hypothetical protein